MVSQINLQTYLPSFYFLASCLTYLLYSMLIYHRSNTGSLRIYLTFSAINAIALGFPSYNLPHWCFVPLLLNSTRIELWFDLLMIHSNNTLYALLKLTKNFFPMVVMYLIAFFFEKSASFFISIIFMQMIG